MKSGQLIHEIKTVVRKKLSIKMSSELRQFRYCYLKADKVSEKRIYIKSEIRVWVFKTFCVLVSNSI